MKKFLNVFFIFAIAFVSSQWRINTTITLATSASVDTSTSVSATTNQAQRKTFYDTVHNKNWVFYYNGAAIEYAYSNFGTTWTTSSTLAYNTPNFAITYKTISGTSYVFVVAECQTYDICVQRGTLGTSSISFGSSIVVLDGSSDSDKYTRPSIALNASNYVWVTAIKDTGITLADHLQSFATRSTNVASGSLSTWGSTSNVGRNVSQLNDAVILPRTGSQMLMILNTDTPNIVSYLYNGSSWVENNTGGNYSWFNYPGGITGTVYDIAILGSNIYVGGNFANGGGNDAIDNIACWDGSSWQTLDTGLSSTVYSIVVDGSDIYAGGDFINAGGDANADYVARWDGSSWNSLGDTPLTNDGFSVNVYSLVLNGSDLYAGGYFTDAGGDTNADSIAKWDGSSWSAIGNDPMPYNSRVYSFAVVGSNVYLGGDFLNVGDANGDYIVRWNGSSWSALGTGLSGAVTAIAVKSPSEIYMGGGFSNAGGDSNADGVAMWNGSSWNALGTGVNSYVKSLFLDGDNLYVGGSFWNAGGVTGANGIALWDGSIWSDVDISLSGEGTVVEAILFSLDDQLIVGGGFSGEGTNSDLDYLIIQKSGSWQGFGKGFSERNGKVTAIAVDGANIYVGGEFTNAFGDPNADYLVYWNGSTWGALDDANPFNERIYALTVYNDDLYVGGSFSNAGGDANADAIVRWDGSAFHALGSSAAFDGYSTIYALAGSDDGLYIGGYFENVDGKANADSIVRWDGVYWNALDTGTSGSVSTIAVSGSDVYVGGSFDTAGEVTANSVARWDGSSWNALDKGTSGWMGAGYVYTISISGSNVYVGGQYLSVKDDSNVSVPNTNNIAMWNGSSWSAMGTGITGNAIYASAVQGTDIYFGGNFTDAGGVSNTQNLAIWDGSAWQVVDGGMADGVGVEALSAPDADNLYVGTDTIFALSDGNHFSRMFSHRGLAVATDTDVSSEISAINDPSGNIGLIYTNSSDDLIFKLYTFGSWGSAVTIRTGTVSNPSLSYDPTTDNLYAFWIEGNAVQYKKGVSPYTADDWDTNPTTLYSTGTNTNLSSDASLGGGIIKVMWTNGASSPYTIYTHFIKTDSTAPSGSIQISNNTTYTKTAVNTLKLSASDSGAGVGYMRFSNNNSSWSSWQIYATAKSWNLTSGYGASTIQGTKRVYAQFTDKAGNTSTKSDTIIYDKTAPTGTIKIKNGASSTRSRYVTLNIRSIDGVAGNSKMQLSNNGTSFTTWKTYATKYTRWNLASGYGGNSHKGTKKVYVKFKDKAGNISVKKYDTIKWKKS